MKRRLPYPAPGAIMEMSKLIGWDRASYGRDSSRPCHSVENGPTGRDESRPYEGRHPPYFVNGHKSGPYRLDIASLAFLGSLLSRSEPSLRDYKQQQGNDFRHFGDGTVRIAGISTQAPGYPHS